MSHSVKKKKTLNSTFLTVLSTTMIPVLVLVIVFSFIMFQNMNDQVLKANFSEMQLFMNQFDNDVSAVTERIKRIGRDYYSNIYYLEDESLINYNLWVLLRDVRSDYNTVDLGFVITEFNINLTFDNAKYTYTEIQILKDMISRKIEDLEHGYTYSFLDDEAAPRYLMFYIDVNKASFGYIIDMEDYMRPMNQSQDHDSVINHISMDQPASSGKNDLVVQSSETNIFLRRRIENSVLYASIPMGMRFLFFLGLLSLVFFPVQWISTKHYVLSPLERINSAMRELEMDNMEFRLEKEEETREFSHISEAFNHMADQIKNLKIEAYEKDIEQLRMENANLQLQVNPHLLLNCLNMIYSLAKSKKLESIEELSMWLSKYFRYMLYNHKDFSSIKEEMDFINNYMVIQKMRFPDSFNYIIDVDETLEDALVPTMLIQNFVENAIKYGLNLESEIDIIVIIKEKDDRLVISVVDTGNGMEETMLENLTADSPSEDFKHKHIGIWNSRNRLHYYYGDESVLNISSKKGEGTQVWIEIPKKGGNIHELVNG